MRPATRAVATELPAGLGDPPRPGFTSAYAVTVPDAAGRSAQAWLRAVWEDAPLAIRLALLTGWTLLGLPPRRASPARVLGWDIASSASAEVVVRRESAVLQARNVLTVDADRIVLSTLVGYKNPLGRIAWGIAIPIHRVLARLLLTRAARRAG